MKKLLLLPLFVLTLWAQGQYDPSKATVTNKPLGVAQGVPTDARSYYYSPSLFIWRPYQSTTEVLSSLNIAKYRMGNFPIYVNVGGTLNSNGTFTGGTIKEYWFKDGTTDADLVEKFSAAAGGSETLSGTIAQLRALTTGTGKVYTSTDRGGGVWIDIGLNDGQYTDDGVNYIITANDHAIKRQIDNEVNVLWFGAKPDAAKSTGAFFNSGSNILHAGSALFTSADIGKKFAIKRPTAPYQVYKGTITGFISSTQVNTSLTFTDPSFSGGGILFFGTDNAASIQQAIDVTSSIKGSLLIPTGTFGVASTLYGTTNMNLKGFGTNTNLCGLGVTGPVLQTSRIDVYGNENTSEQITDFNISGYSTVGLVFNQTITSHMGNIRIEDHIGTYGFIFESSYSNTFGALRTNGSQDSIANFMFGKTVLASTFDMVYTSNFAQYNILIDGTSSLYSNNSNVGFGGVLTFSNITLQGGTKNGMWIKDAYGVNFETVYIENAHNPIRLGDRANNKVARFITFNSLPIANGGGDNAEYGLLIDNAIGTTIQSFSSAYDVVYNSSIGTKINNARFGFTQADQPRNYLKRTSNSVIQSGINIKYQNTEWNSEEEILKVRDFSHGHVQQYYDETGHLITELFTPDVKTLLP